MNALADLAEAEDSTLDEMSATLAAVEPILRAATPETFGVATLKSLENKRTLVRKAVRLVDPLSTGARTTCVEALPSIWKEALAAVGHHLKEHETSQKAILRRLATFCARCAIVPSALPEATVDAFVATELATHSPGYEEKLRAAFRRWNGAAAVGVALPALPLPGAPVRRQKIVAWSSVPAAIRAPLDVYLATAVSIREPGDWGAFVADEDPDYAELGIAFAPEANDGGGDEDAAPLLEPGTRRNWRDAVKRAWHAAAEDPRVAPKPAQLEDLFTRPVVTALVAAVRRSRRDRLEAAGRVFDPKKKGRYEHSLVEALCSVGRVLSVDAERLAVIEDLKVQVDPNVVGMKRGPDGGFERVYAERRIGDRHATMLAAFGDLSRLRRWFEAPSVLWGLACRPIEAGRAPQATHVALARSALVARIGQYVAPIRRTNFARLRYRGEDPHIFLPEGHGEGKLVIPPNEGKTLREIHVCIDAETVRMLRYYIRHFLPVAQARAAATPDNPHLFPGACGAEAKDGGYAPGRGFLTKEKLNGSFGKHMKKHCGLNLCLHVMRHLAGKVILDQDPSAMALVKEILGHKRLRTTQAYYAEVCKIVAQRRYIHLLEQRSRKALANVSFRFVDPPTGKET